MPSRLLLPRQLPRKGLVLVEHSNSRVPGQLLMVMQPCCQLQGSKTSAPAAAELTPGFHEMRHSLSQSGGATGADDVLSAVVVASAAKTVVVDEGALHCMPHAKKQSVVDRVQLVTQGTSFSHRVPCPI